MFDIVEILVSPVLEVCRPLRRRIGSCIGSLVIKANGYGHGLLNAALGLKEADGFAVLSLDEALTLRSAGYQQTILLLEGAFSADELEAISQHQISLVVHCDAQIDMLCNAQLPHPVSVHLKLNTGMNRLGFVPAHFPRALDCLKIA